MSRDARTFIKLHDGMPDHPKVEGLSDGAFRLLVETWCWCSRHLTDGVVPGPSWRRRGTPKARKELVDAGLAQPSVDGGVVMHDYTEHQRTAAEVEAIRQRNAANGRAGGLAKAKRVASESPTESSSRDRDRYLAVLPSSNSDAGTGVAL